MQYSIPNYMPTEVCPFCHSVNLKMYIDRSCCSVTCLNCRAEGPQKKDFSKAVSAWNYRPTFADLPTLRS